MINYAEASDKAAQEFLLFDVAEEMFLAHYNATADIIVSQGGTSSGKTYTILQVLFRIASEQEHKIITVVGQDIPNLKSGALRDALSIVRSSPILQSLIKSYNKTDRIFEFNNGSIIEFKSYTDAQDAKSGKRDYLFCNEANGIPFAIYVELVLRTYTRTFVDYNPNGEFWVHENVIGQPNVQLIISDHRHNPFLNDKTHASIEALKDIDFELWRVYARGLTGKIEGLVFRNWQQCKSIPEHANLIGYGLDFGFTNDPTAMTAVYMADGELYVDELIYERGLTNSDLNKRMQEQGVSKQHFIIADSADPKSIEELKRLGWKIEGANKGGDSINSSIDILKRYPVNYTRHSVNLNKEVAAYKWKIDRATGKPLNVPVDFMNHLLDGIRYVALNRLSTVKKFSKAKFVFRKK